MPKAAFCGETLRGKIPSVVRHCRRLRAHECCPFIPSIGLLGVSQFVPAGAQAECRRISTGVHINKAVRRCACGSNGGFVPEHRLSCAVIRVFEGCKRTAHGTARHLQCKRAGQRPLCLPRAHRGRSAPATDQGTHLFCSPSSRPASQGRLQTLRPPVRTVLRQQLSRVIIAAACIQLFPLSEQVFVDFQIAVGVRTRRLAVCHRRVSVPDIPARRDALMHRTLPSKCADVLSSRSR